MVVYSFYIFDRHAECIYKRKYLPPGHKAPSSIAGKSASTNASRPASSAGGGIEEGPAGDASGASISGSGAGSGGGGGGGNQSNILSAEDDAKLIFGTIFSLRNMVRKLGGIDDNFVSFRTAQYKLHYYETPTSLKFVMVTDTKMNNLRIVLHQIYVGLYVEYVVKNPLSPAEHPGGIGVDCETFEVGLDQFINSSLQG